MSAGMNVSFTSVVATEKSATFVLSNIASGTLYYCTVEVYRADDLTRLVAATERFTFVNNTSMPTSTGNELMPETDYVAIFKSDGMTGAQTTFTTQAAPELPKVFRYWTKDGQKFDFTEQVTSNFTLEAAWANVYTVSFIDSFGETVAPDQNVVSASEFPFVLPEAPIVPGMKFTGWYSGIDGHKWNPNVDVVTQNMTLIAVYAPADI